jgi:hypothetical protein
MNKYGGMDISLHAFLTSALDRNESLAWNDADGISDGQKLRTPGMSQQKSSSFFRVQMENEPGDNFIQPSHLNIARSEH